MNAQQLRNSILQEAIEGRLVPQDPNDEPASALLERIREEKRRLVKEGKLKKKDLVETPITEDEKPFEIPESWEWCRLGDIGIFERGNGIKRDETTQEGFPCVRYGEMYTRYRMAPTFKKTFSFTSKDVFDKCRKAHYGDLFMALTGENKQDIALAAQYIGEEEVAVGGDLCHFTILKAYALYFVYLINSLYFSNKKEVLATGDIIVHISTDKLGSISIPLPPLAEQQRIVAKIEELMPKVEEYGKAQEALDKLNAELPEKLKKSILQEAIEGRLVPQDPNDEPASVLLDKIRKEKAQLVKEGKLKKKDLVETPISEDEKPFEIPESWEWCRLGWIGEWGAGATPAKGNPEFYSNGTIPWLRTGELNNGYVYDSEIKVTSKALEKCSLRMCKVGDVLIAMYGATIGKVAIAGIELTTNQACCACTPLFLYNKYLLYYLMASKKTFMDMGEGGAQPNISREKIVAFPFPLPPLAEQHRIVAKIEEMFSEINKLEKA